MMTNKKPKTTKSTKPAEPVTEPEARAAYIKMEGRRSIRGLHQRFVKEGKKTPSLRTMQKWSMKHQWVRLAREHDEKVASGAAERIADAATAGVVTRAAQFDTLATPQLGEARDELLEAAQRLQRALDVNRRVIDGAMAAGDQLIRMLAGGSERAPLYAADPSVNEKATPGTPGGLLNTKA